VQSSEPVRFVLLKDPAINQASPEDGGSDKSTYKATSGRDRTGLVFVDEPTEFHVKPLSPSQTKDAQTEGLRFDGDQARNVAMCREAFWLGCKVIKPWVGEDGTTGELPRSQWDEQLALSDMVEIGGYILALSNMEATDPKS
jgi:hypothetical protein